MKRRITTFCAIIGMMALFFISARWNNVLSTNLTQEKLFEMEIYNCQNDDSLKAGLLRAQNLAQQGKKEEASRIYTNLMEIYLHEKEPVKGWLILNMKRAPTGEEEAIQSLDQLGKQYQKNSAIIFWRMFLEAEHGHNEAALKDVDFLIKLQPDSAVNWVAKGQICAEMKQFDEASKAFDKATKLDPKRGDVWGMKAGTLAKLGKFDEALVSANKGIELMPGHPVGIYNRACIYCLKGDKIHALEDLGTAFTKMPQLKQHARSDEDLKSLWEDEEFKNLTK